MCSSQYITQGMAIDVRVIMFRNGHLSQAIYSTLCYIRATAVVNNTRNTSTVLFDNTIL